MTIVCGDSHTADARRLRRAGLRHRHERSRACAGDADACRRCEPKTMEIRVDGELPPGVDRQGRDPGHHRPDRHRRRRPATSSSITGERDPRALDGRADDGLQHVDRSAAPAPGMIAPDETTFAYLRGPRARARRARTSGTALDAMAELPQRRRRDLRPRVVDRCGDDHAARHLGHQSRAWSCRSRQRARSRVVRRRERDRMPPSARWRYMDLSRARRSRISRSIRVFIGSCTNAGSRTCAPPPRSSRATRSLPSVQAMVVPGSHAGQGAGRG